MIDKIKNIALGVLSILLLIVTAGAYRTKAQAADAARKRAEVDASVAKALADEMAKGEAEERRKQSEDVDITTFTRGP